MSYKVSYWDETSGTQQERDATPEEASEIEAMRSSVFTNNRADLVRQIDLNADEIYGNVVGNRTTEYTMAEADAKAYVEAGYPDDAPPSVAVWAQIKGETLKWAAEDITQTAAAWRTAQNAIRAQRLSHKEQARKAEDEEALEIVAQSWRGFVTNVKAQLGIV